MPVKSEGDGVGEAMNQHNVSQEQLLNHYIAVTKHKWEVFKQLGKVCLNLLSRGIVHDLTKYLDDEAMGFAKYTDILEGLSYGSDKYKEVMGEFRDIIELHYSRNQHHPEYYDGTLDKMGLLDQIEMICDWKAATKRHADGSIIDSIYHNQERFDYSNAKAAKIFLLTLYTGIIEERDIENSKMIKQDGLAGIVELKKEFVNPVLGWQETDQGEEYHYAEDLDHAQTD